MKILVFSDSHRALGDMVQVIQTQNPDTVIHLGDLQQDAEELSYAFPSLPLISVPGNCDGWTTSPLTRLIHLENQSILLSHGHLWRVKMGYEHAILQARKAGATILLFGHTHIPYCQRLEDGLWVMNPGAGGSSGGSVGLIETRDGHISSCQILHQADLARLEEQL